MLNSLTIKATAIAIANLLAFLVVFHLLQNPKIYHSTLGKISNNFERIGGWHGEIHDVKKPYTQINNNNLLHWDAAIYDCIRQHLYAPANKDCFDLVRPAFFPLFPIVWRISGLNAIGICLFNYLIFAASLFCLIRLFDIEKPLFWFAFSLLLPGIMVFFIPYSEAIFFATFAIAAAGFLKQKYWLYTLEMFALAMARPAAFFVPMAILSVILLHLFSGKISLRKSIREAFLLCAPYVTGLTAVFLLQYYYTGNFLALIDAQKYWAVKLGWPTHIHDWSVEGFGLNSAAIFFFVIPALLVLISSVIKRNFTHVTWNTDRQKKQEFLLYTSAAYAVLMFLYVIFFRGGSLHSFFRFTLTSPFFYIFIFLLIPKIQHWKISRKLLIYILVIVPLIFYLLLVDYGWSRLNFKFAGLYLTAAFTFLYFIEAHISTRAKMLWLCFFGVLSLVWCSYLFNMFLSNAWVIT